MFLETEELKSVIYEYQLTEITESDEDIPVMAINAAIEEMKSYLRPKRIGQPQYDYDVDAIFNATGNDRNPLILELCKSIALYNLCELSNVDVILEKVQKRYERAIDWLEKVSGTGKYTGNPPINAGLPIVIDTTNEADLPYRFGSRDKFAQE